MGCVSHPYEESTLKSFYNDYNANIENHFSQGQFNYLKINLSDPNALEDLNTFIRPFIRFKSMPHSNKSKQ